MWPIGFFAAPQKIIPPGKFFHDLRYLTEYPESKKEYPGVKENGYWISLINNYYGQRMVKYPIKA